MVDNTEHEPPHEIGYRKPPKQTQFAKGQSGNPKGRPKGSRNFGTVIQSELRRRVRVTEDGRRKKITKREAIAKQVINKGAAGDLKAIPIVLNEARLYEADAATDSAKSDAIGQEDQAVIENIVKRIREATSGANSPESSQQPPANHSQNTAPPEEDGIPQ